MAIDNSVYLKHIRDAIYRIEGYVSEMSKDEFLIENNEMARAAVVRELEIIGEAARHVDKEFTQMYPELPWREMIDTRNSIIHDYMSVDYELVWDILVTDLSVLKDQVENIVGTS